MRHQPTLVIALLCAALAAPPAAAEDLTTESRTARGLTSVVTSSLAAQDAPYEVITAADLRDVLALDAVQQLAGCVDDDCMSEIGPALGTRYVVFGRLDEVGDLLLLNLSLVDTSQARVVRRVSVTGKDEAALVESARTAVSGLVAALQEEGADRVLVLDVQAPPPDPELHVLALSGAATAAAGLGLFTLTYVTTAVFAATTLVRIRAPEARGVAFSFIPLVGPFLVPFASTRDYGNPLWLGLGTVQALTVIAAAAGGGLWLLAPDEE